MAIRSFIPFPTMTTSRLMLRSYKDTDAAALAMLRSDPGVNQYLTRLSQYPLAAAQSHITSTQQALVAGESIVWAICLVDIQVLIGTICLWQFTADGHTAEVGYELLPTYHGQGLMTEAMQAVIDYAEANLHISILEAYTHRENVASIKLLERFGYALQPHRIDAENEYHNIYVRVH